MSRRGQVAPKPGWGGEVEVAQGTPVASNGSSGTVEGQQESSVSAAPANMDLQAGLRALANKDAELANKDAELCKEGR